MSTRTEEVYHVDLAVGLRARWERTPLMFFGFPFFLDDKISQER